MGQPAKPIEEMIEVCRTSRQKIIVWGVAISSAEVFKLFGAEAIKDHLIAEPLAGLVHKNSGPLETWKGPPPAPTVEAYVYQLGQKFVYIAYYYFAATGTWTIKSFKENESSHLVMRSVTEKTRQEFRHAPFRNVRLGQLAQAFKATEDKGEDDEK